MKHSGQRRQRLGSAAAVALLHAALGSLLLLSFVAPPPLERRGPLATFDLAADPPPRPPATEIKRPAEEAPSAHADHPLAAVPSPASAPALFKSPLPALLVTSAGQEGAGTDHADVGNGSGGLGTGIGAGTGSGSVAASRARKIAGLISNRDYPRQARRAGAQGRVVSRLEIDSNGRVLGCATLFTSGHETLDRATCALIKRRFRFVPARDPRMQAVPDRVDWETIWWLGHGTERVGSPPT